MVSMALLELRLLGAEDHKSRLEHYLRGRYTEDQKVRKAIKVLKIYQDTGDWPFVYVLGKCPVKGCKYAERVKVETVLSQTGYATNIESLSRLRKHVCPEHKGVLRFKEVEGLYNPKVPCDRRCTGAKGHKCECSCGGANHGKDWDYKEEIL